MTGEWLTAWDRSAGAHSAAELFRSRFGAEPDGVWSAPGRVNLIGEHTDYNGGLCLPIDLPHRTYVALRRRDDDVLRLVSEREHAMWTGTTDQVHPGAHLGWAAYAAGVAWAVNESADPAPATGADATGDVRATSDTHPAPGTRPTPGTRVAGFDAAVASCVPYGAGLSSSAALESAVAVALDDVCDLGLGDSDAGRAVLAAACVRAENEIAGAPTGGMDQSSSLRAQPGHALLLDTRDGTVRHVPFDLSAHGLALLVIDTRAEHQLADGQYANRRATCEAAAARLGHATLREVGAGAELEAALALLAEPGDADAETTIRRVRHVATEIARVEDFVALLDAGRVAEVGPLMDASHASLRDDYEVSCAELDLAVSVARANGALGARMTGGGFGGSAIALVEADGVERIASAIADAFGAAGFTSPVFLVADASAPADRDTA
ncbi:galactokinase [Cellulomonas sp. P24]|uniref:galactokinase n=1 Tax=Cellulomonas sp. P24 TaxID=2885206 RepID=UPI00216AB6F1|nr:galactokinase [Cellulomonas sp. P24]MCR6492156.1 galactokinase [Cellulomonas sp. P24]